MIPYYTNKVCAISHLLYNPRNRLDTFIEYDGGIVKANVCLRVETVKHYLTKRAVRKLQNLSRLYPWKLTPTLVQNIPVRINQISTTLLDWDDKDNAHKHLPYFIGKELVGHK